MFTAVRTLGAATFAYSAALIIRPAVLAKPCGLTDADGTVPEAAALLIRAVGARDSVIGAAMFSAPDHRTIVAVTACRVAADLSDAVLFNAALTGTTRRVKIAGFAGLWGVLCAAAVVHGLVRSRQSGSSTPLRC